MPGYDSSAFWARGGVGHVLTPPDQDQPVRQRGAMGDRNGAMSLAFGIAAALLRRERTGRGSVVDVSLLATAMWTLSSDVLAALQGGKPRSPSGRDVSPNPLVGTFLGTVSEDGLQYRLPAVPVQIDERPPPMRRAPEHGGHTEAVLLELGYEWDEIIALRDAGVLP